jgi:hypothetical protein
VLARPLRGALFENLGVGEALKWFWHRGRRSALHYYPDADWNEIALLPELANGVYPNEIKTWETVNPHPFRSLRAFARRCHPPPPDAGGLVHAGDRAQVRQGVTVVPFTRTAELIEAIAA